MGTCTVSSPMPERRQALAARMDAPAMPYEPAISSPCPKLPLWANRLRGFISRCISSSSMMEYLLSAVSIYVCFKPMFNRSQSPIMSSFSGKKNESLGNWMLRDVGVYDVLTDIVGIVFPHQSRRNVDGHDFRLGGIDVFDNSRKSSAQGLVQSTSEEPVYHQMLVGQCRWIELCTDFRQIANWPIKFQVERMGSAEPGAIANLVPRDLGIGQKNREAH